MNVNLSRALKTVRAASLPLLTAVLLTGIALSAPESARAQTAPPNPPSPSVAVPTATNPFPSPMGDPQNRGRSPFDLFWGVTDGNFLYNQTPMSRIPDQNSNSLVGLSSWSYPFAIDSDTTHGAAYGRLANTYGLSLSAVVAPGIVVDDVPLVAQAEPPATTPPLTGTGSAYTTGTGVWDNAGTSPLPGGIATAPGQDPQGGSYHRTVAVQRPAGNAFDYFLTNNSFFGGANAAKRSRVIAWFPAIPGAAGTMKRYAVRVLLPAPTANDPAENRVTDARYIVHYYVRLSNGTLLNRYKICFVGQDTDSSSKYLSETPGGTPAYFPFFSEATYDPANAGAVAVPDGREFVAVDNTTSDDLGNGPEYVIADALSLEQRVAIVRAAPTLSPLGPGRKIDPTTAHQPAGGPNYTVGFTGTQMAAGHTPAELLITNGQQQVGGAVSAAPTGVVMPNSSFAFANSDPRDPDYVNGLGGAGTLPYDPNNPAVLFQGPEAFVKWKVLPTQYGAPYGTATGPGIGTYQPIPQPYLPTNLVATDTTYATYNAAQAFATQNILPVPPTDAPQGPHVDAASGLTMGDSGGTQLQYDPQNAPAAYNNLTPDAAAAPFAQVIQRVSANNFEIYRPNMDPAAPPTYDLTNAGGNRPTPLYSHVQVIVARTVFVPDPETGVSAAAIDGTRTIEVGEVLGLDWQTGAVLWRFPDRTYLPDVQAALVAQGSTTSFTNGYPEPDGSGVAPQSGLRNKFVGFQQVKSPTGTLLNAYALYQVPGILPVDVNGDGRIEDNEVFIAPTPGTSSGGLYSSVTVAAGIPVQGRVDIPLYNPDQSIPNGNDGSPIIGVAPAPAGRYYTDATAANPVPVTVAYVASQNGVVYAIDAHGNNDNRYREAVYNNTAGIPEYDPTVDDPNLDPQSGVAARRNPDGPKRVGIFHPGTTNVLWTFQPMSGPRLNGQTATTGGAAQVETAVQYYRRLKTEIPAPIGYGSSAPVIAYRYDENVTTGPIGPEGLPAPAGYGRATTNGTFGTDEPRLFIGNQNGVLYALDAAALSVGPTSPGEAALPTLPFRKGDQFTVALTDPVSTSHRTDLRWWFETEAVSAAAGGAINSTPAVSLNQLAANVQSGGTSAASAQAEKGVYVTSAVGRVYALDWTGPFRTDDAGHFSGADGRLWDGTEGTVTTASPPSSENGAATFNDNLRFHNLAVANPLGIADNSEGTIRPRWVYPSQYQDIDATSNIDTYNAPDQVSNLAATGVPVRDTALAPIYGSVSLMDFVWTKPGTTTPVVKHYVAFAANDATNGVDTPTVGKLYLLDQAGDRGAIMTNPIVTSGTKRVYSSPIDQFALKTMAVGAATPAWTYRFQYGTYDAAGNRIIQGSNNGLTGDPTANPNLSLNHPTPQAVTTTAPQLTLPENQLADINLAQPSRRTVPTVFFGGVGRVWAVDIDLASGVFLRWRQSGGLQPIPLPLDGGGVQAGVVPTGGESSAYILPWRNPDLIGVPNVAGGELYTRQILARTVPTGDASSVDGSLTITGGPLQTRDSTLNLTPAPASLPMVPPTPTYDAPNLLPPGYGRSAAETAPAFAARLDASGRYVNQEIDDPLATTRGAHYTFALDAVNQRPENDLDVSFQFPVLFITSAGATSGDTGANGGGLYEVSTNLEGEDTSTLGSGINQTSALAWALSNDLTRGNRRHVYQLSLTGGPGGVGSGIAVLTAAYYPGLDPTFRTNKTATYPAGDPTEAAYPAYPAYEPGIEPTDPATGNVPAARNTDATRSGGVLHPRGFFTGDPATAPPLAVDLFTGQSGLPLDLNGLFFAKRVALRDSVQSEADVAAATPGYVTDPSLPPTLPGQPTVMAEQRWIWGGPGTLATDDDGRIALPGWSGMLAANADATYGLGVAGGLNGLPDGIHPRAVAVGAQTKNGNNDDVNPTAENAVWIFSGGPDGALYAYTPTLPRRFGGPGGSGLPGGTPIANNEPSYLNPQPKFDIFPAAYATGLDGNTRPDRAQSLAVSGQNYFEWGESIYVVAWDFAVAAPTPKPGFENQVPPYLANPPASVAIDIVDASGGVIKTLRGTRTSAPPNRVLPGQYDMDLNNDGQITYDEWNTAFPGEDPDLFNNSPMNPPALGVAVFRFDLDGTTIQTPGTVLHVRLNQSNANSQIVNANTGVRTILGRSGLGANDAEIRENLEIPFMIANPIAIQGFVTDTQGNVATIAGADTGNYTVNSIGPFESVATGGGSSKLKVAHQSADGTPDRRSVYYSQALANGNKISRIDIRPYLNGDINQRNRNVGNKVTDNGLNTGTPEPDYYIPVVVDAGYGSHGGTATTDATTAAGTARYLHVANRSLLAGGLPKVRVQLAQDMLWRTWPGAVPNVDATDGGTLADGTPSAPGGVNGRLTPVQGGAYAMRTDGIVNYLPWEQPVPEVQPWKSSTTGAQVGAGGNSSQDYPDMSASSRTLLTASSGGVDPTQGAVRLQPSGDPAAGANANLNVNQTLLETSPVLNGFAAGFGMTLNVNVPKYQPANLVAMHSLLSTYQPQSALTDTLGSVTTTGSAPVQLPYDPNNAGGYIAAHRLVAGGADTVAPYGYTSQVRVYVDFNNNSRWDDGEAYRDVELWMGVPVDMNLASVESPIEISGPSGAVSMGFGLQNGFLGYNLAGGDPAFLQGFLPTPLANPNFFTVDAANPVNAPYSPFFKRFTIQNRGNVNLWNLRASQRESLDLDGSPFGYYQLRSTSVDPVQGIEARGMDPGLGTTPHIVTSLDDNLDNAWNTMMAQGAPNNPFNMDAATYARYYQLFGGRHTLHKARVGSSTDTTLSVPDVPSSVDLGNLGNNNVAGTTVPITPQVPYVSVAVPIGTPSGIYGPPDTAPADFVVFEDHDTATQYLGAPLPNGAGVAPAGPLYAGRNLVYQASFPNAGTTVLPNGAGGTYRPRALPPAGATSIPASDFLPHTDPGIRLRVTVGEGALTGQIVDSALPLGTFLPAVTTGVLPFIDTRPLIDASNPTAGYRPAAALSPAAYRSPDGSLHVFFSRNSNATDANGTAQPGSPYNLFVSDLAWNATAGGVWQASTPATSPAAGNYDPATGAGPTGQWFTPPAAITVPTQPAGSSNTSPFVLQDWANGGAATLFFLNTTPTAGGQPVRSIYYAPLTTNGNGTTAIGTPQPWVENADPSLQRFSPRAVYEPTSGTDILFYYGGVGGKWSLYYSPRPAQAGGVPTGAAPVASTTQSEFPLSLPLSISTASDPVPVVRTIEPSDGTGNTNLVYGPTVVDVYYTGIAGSDKAPGVYMTRYLLDTRNGTGVNARLVPAPLPRRTFETLAVTPGTTVYTARDIAWIRDPQNAANLPVIHINAGQANAVDTAAANWRYDDATNMLVQRLAFNPGTGNQVLYVYADTSAGTVRFRGSTATLRGVRTVSADYTPQTARIASGAAPVSGTFGFFDDRQLPASAQEQAQVQQTNNPSNFINARPTNALIAGRTWVFWRQAAQGSAPATLHYVTRRVGVDLKSVPTNQGGMDPSTAQPESIRLSQDNPVGSGIQTPLITGLAIDGAAVGDAEVDVANGRIYVDPRWEGHRIQIQYEAVKNGNPTGQRTVTTTVTQIQDIDPTQPAVPYNGKSVGLQRSINEGQPYAFLDRYGYAAGQPTAFGAGALGRSGAAPNEQFDPTLQPGKVWLFWTSPRSRSGTLRDPNSGAYPFVVGGQNVPVTGYDIYWETLAPWFGYDSFKPAPAATP